MQDSVNATTELPLGGDVVTATLVTAVKDLPVHGRAIVVNPNPTPAYVAASPRRFVPPFSSTVLVDIVVEQADSVVLLRTAGELMSELTGQPGWHRFGDLLAPGEAPGFPRDTALWRGPRSDIGAVTFDPITMLGESSVSAMEREFQVWINLWFAPAATDCVIHNEHDFLETHAQIDGMGRMQKFTAPRHAALYEDVLMSQGATHAPFCGMAADGTFVYPWHQYRADTDCVWLAVEYHAQPNRSSQ